MAKENVYPIGEPGVPWGDAEKARWLARQSVRRSYAEQVRRKLDALDDGFAVEQYGGLSLDPERYPLYAVRVGTWGADRPVALITGGVHGYETSGVQGALRFLETRAERYADAFNIVVAPCVSPWGYETINRWNPIALDPNRSFRANSDCEEAAALMAFLESAGIEPLVHLDLHETTDTDNTEFRPALAARDANPQSVWDIPDGFYTVGDSARPTPDFQRAIIESVATVTHIAPADSQGTIIGKVPEQDGVIHYAAAKFGLCMGVTAARWVTTTEVYPDSPKVDDENCIVAQVAAVDGALQFAQRSGG